MLSYLIIFSKFNVFLMWQVMLQPVGTTGFFQCPDSPFSGGDPLKTCSCHQKLAFGPRGPVGHKDPATSRIYTHIVNGELEDAMKKIRNGTE